MKHPWLPLVFTYDFESLRIFDYDSRSCISSTRIDPLNATWGIAFHPIDYCTFVTTHSSSDHVKVWTLGDTLVESGRLAIDRVASLKFVGWSSCGTYVVAMQSGAFPLYYVWDFRTRKQLHNGAELATFKDPITSFHCLKDEPSVVFAYGNKVFIMDIPTWTKKSVFEIEGKISHSAISDEYLFLTERFPNWVDAAVVKVYSLKSRRCVRRIALEEQFCTAMSWGYDTLLIESTRLPKRPGKCEPAVKCDDDSTSGEPTYRGVPMQITKRVRSFKDRGILVTSVDTRTWEQRATFNIVNFETYAMATMIDHDTFVAKCRPDRLGVFKL